jgi:hypothetical protein
MAILNSSNIPQVANEAGLVAYAVLPVSNDIVQLADGTLYTFREGSSAVADGVYVVDQTVATALGRWFRTISVKGISSYAITLEDNPSGGISDKADYTAVGLLTSNFNVISYTPLASGLIVSGVQVSADGLISVKYENNTGSDVTGIVLNVKVLTV